VKKTDATANAVTVDPNAAETVDGAATFALANRYAEIMIESDGANWWIVSSYADPLLLADGAVGAPAYAFKNSKTTGAFSPGTNRLALAANGIQGLEVDVQGYVDLATQPRCVAYNSGTQTVTAGNTTALTLDSEDVDVGSMHSTSANTSRLTVPTGGDGFYEITGKSVAQITGNATKAELSIKKNGTTFLDNSVWFSAANLNNDIQTLAVLWKGTLAAGDYVELYGQATTNNVQFGSATRKDSTTFTAEKAA
jgi:hypothetical protein